MDKRGGSVRFGTLPTADRLSSLLSASLRHDTGDTILVMVVV